jgi:hypothetical protein
VSEMDLRVTPTLVILGKWNRAILRPEWFNHIIPGISPSNASIPFEFSMDTGDVRFTLDDVRIQPTEHKLELVVDTNEDDKCKKLMNIATKIVENLPHTPIGAIGHNIAYNLTTEALKDMISDAEYSRFDEIYQNLFLNASLNEYRVRHSIGLSEYTLNLTYNKAREQVYIDFNFHYTVTNLESIKESISNFADNILESQSIAAKLQSRA